MTGVVSKYPDHGDANNWGKLEAEEARCLVALKKYYEVAEGKDDIEALELAWIDLKREFGRLMEFVWYK